MALSQDLSISIYQTIAKLRKPREIKMWHSSSIAKCPRALYMERLKVPALNSPTAAKEIRFTSGHAVETALRAPLEELDKDLQSNIRLRNKDLDLTGEYDNLVPSQKRLIEIKSVDIGAVIQRNNVLSLKKEVGLDEKGRKLYEPMLDPYKHHIWQQESYCLLMETPGTEYFDTTDPDNKVWRPLEPMTIEAIDYIYVTLRGALVAYKTPRSPHITKRVADKVKYLNEALKDSKLPICMCSESQEFWKETNQYCDYQSEGECCSPKLVEALKK